MKIQKFLCTMLFVALLISQLFVVPAPAAPHHQNIPISYLVQFGDSISDTGNLNIENPLAAHGAYISFPYGETIGKATGRASDGLLMVDHFADHFHLPHLSPSQNPKANFASGINFAVAGSTALTTAELHAHGVVPRGSPSSLNVQLERFNLHLNSLCGGNPRCIADILQNSLILMGEVGGNDYNFAMSRVVDIPLAYRLVPQVIERIVEAIREVIHQGATRIVVPGNFAIGCMPINLNKFLSVDPRRYDEHHCLRALNDMASYHNNHLQQAIKQLQTEYPHARIVYADYYNGLKWLLEETRMSNGVSQRACCGDRTSPYGINLDRMCGSGSYVCPNPNNHVSWDGIHLTGHAYQRLAAWLLQRITPHLH